MRPQSKPSLPRALAALLVLAPLAGAPAPSRAEDAPDEAVRVRALLLFNTNDPSIGDSVAADLKNVRSLLEAGFKAKYGAKYTHHLDVKELSGRDFTRDGVLKYFENLKTDDSETLLVFYGGHGGYSGALGQIFAMDGDNILLRTDLARLIVEKHPRLSVLLSDTCNLYLDRTETEAAPRAPNWETIRNLFLLPRGLVDINSVSEGESAYGQVTGGYFTETLCDLLRENFGKLDTNKDGFVTWDELLPRLQTGTQAKFGRFRTAALKAKDIPAADQKNLEKQEYQTVRAYALPPLLRFGARVLDDGRGALVLLVHDFTPAALAGVKPGDIITDVAGHRIQSADDFQQAVAQARGPVGVTLERGSAVKTVKVALAPWPPLGKEE